MFWIQFTFGFWKDIRVKSADVVKFKFLSRESVENVVNFNGRAERIRAHTMSWKSEASDCSTEEGLYALTNSPITNSGISKVHPSEDAGFHGSSITTRGMSKSQLIVDQGKTDLGNL